ncbi:MAG: heavy metal translocating P-type ATPase [Burkholderiaceae bacterium]
MPDSVLPAVPADEAKPAIDLQIEGMTCAGCVARVTKALEKIPGARAEVSLIEHRARVTGADLEAAVAAIRRAGYTAGPFTGAQPAGKAAQRVSQTAAGGKGQQTPQSPGLLPVTPVSPVGPASPVSPIGPISPASPGLFVGFSQASWESRVAALALAIMVIEMGGMALGAGHGLVPLWLQALLASLMQFWVGAPIAQRGLRALRHGRASMETLILLGTATAYLWSMGLWLGPLVLPIFSVDPTVLGIVGQGPVYFEASVVVLAMMHLGLQLQDRAQARTLAALAPFLHEASSPVLRLAAQPSDLADPASVLPERLTTCTAQELKSGDHIWLAAGAGLPCDGIVVGGSSEFDESGLTGESLPVARGVGDRVIGGTRNISEPVLVRVEGNPDQWRQSQLRDQMMSALASRAPIAEWADKVAAIFVPAVAVLAVMNLVVQTLWGTGFAVALERSIALLVIACPCALGLATPMAIATGLARGAQRGWLFRNAASLQKAAELERVVFDKTGTLTEGRPRLVGIAAVHLPPRAISPQDFPPWLAAAVAAQEGNPHPLAGAFWSHAAGRAEPQACQEAQVLPGLGIIAQTPAGRVILGKPNWVAHQTGGTIPEGLNTAAAGLWPSASQIDIAINGVWQGSVWAQDSVKPDARDAVAALARLGIASALLSGDREGAVRATAEAAAIPLIDTAWGLSPEDKAQRLKQWQSQGQKTAMVGDGINDLAAMAQADLAIALSAGASITLKTADITLTNSQRLLAVAEVIGFCRKVRRRIIENLGFAFGFNLLALPLAASGSLSPAIAGAAMALSSVAVVSNALRLLKD